MLHECRQRGRSGGSEGGLGGGGGPGEAELRLQQTRLQQRLRALKMRLFDVRSQLDLSPCPPGLMSAPGQPIWHPPFPVDSLQALHVVHACMSLRSSHDFTRPQLQSLDGCAVAAQDSAEIAKSFQLLWIIMHP